MVENIIGNCPIYVGADLLKNPPFKQYIRGHQVLIVTQQTVAHFYLPLLQTQLQHYQWDVIYLPEGEQNKTLAVWQKIIETLIEREHDRSTTLIALGGGLVGDMTGFAAACYQRGVAYIQIPTTLMAQVDSSIGGKTGVNHLHAKNMIGLFYHPQCILVDISVLKTLPQREFISGLAEVIKYGLIWDEEFFAFLEKNIEKLLNREESMLQEIVTRCIKIKTEIVSKDEHDRGIRRLLNFGHTLGHALEAKLNYEGILHGEAVAVGMRMAAWLSKKYGYLSEEAVARLDHLLKRSGLFNVISFPDDIHALAPWIKQDKKIQREQVHFVFLEAIGKAVIKKIPVETGILVKQQPSLIN